MRKQAGDWLKLRRADAGLSQAALAERLGMKYYTFISQVENGFSRVPTEVMGAWASELGLEPAEFAKHLLLYYEPELYRLLFGEKEMSVVDVRKKQAWERVERDGTQYPRARH